TDPGPHQRREELCGPHRKTFGDPCPMVSFMNKTFAGYGAGCTAPYAAADGSPLQQQADIHTISLQVQGHTAAGLWGGG
ncbi:hypothetical protein KUCAC02_020252, partial [Chaenocephalus aceratus]